LTGAACSTSSFSQSRPYFSIEGDQWTVEVGPEACSVRPGKVDNADCFLKTTKEIFLGTIKGEYTPSLSDIMSGKVKTNNPILLMTFKSIFADSIAEED
jgi:putative sterol carrier protein